MISQADSPKAAPSPFLQALHAPTGSAESLAYQVTFLCMAKSKILFPPATLIKIPQSSWDMVPQIHW